MTLNDYLIKNNKQAEDLVVLFSVGSVLDKTNGNTYPLNSDSSIDFNTGVMVHLDDVADEWGNSLSTEDMDVVLDVYSSLPDSSDKYSYFLARF